MVLVRWLSGNVSSIDTPILASDLRGQVRARNQAVTLFNTDGEVVPDDQLLGVEELVNVLVSEERQLTDVENSKVLTAFQHHLENSSLTFDTFRQLVVDHHALVAGGSVLGALTDTHINDFDVYVISTHAKSLIKELTNVVSARYHQCADVASTYDRSFFRKNHILIRVPMRFSSNVSVDVVVVADDVALETVVTNFDLSFCEVWWDGSKTYAADPDGIRERVGILKPDYRDCLIREFNPFIARRLQKYKDRGFQVKILGDDLYPEDIVKIFEKNVANIDSGKSVPTEDWAVRFFLKNLYSAIMSYDLWRTNRIQDRVGYGKFLIMFFFEVYPRHYTVDALRAKFAEKFPYIVFDEVVQYIREADETCLPVRYRNKFEEVFGNGDEVSRVTHEELIRMYTQIVKDFELY